MKYKRLGLMFLAFVWFLPAQVSEAFEIRDKVDAINVAGKQRMFTMRMLKDYLAIGENLHYKDPKRDLEQTMAAFEEADKALLAYVTDPKLKAEMEDIQKTWKEVRAMFSQPPVKEKGLLYAKTAIGFREKLNTFVNHMAETYGGTNAQTVNHSGRLRAVSQALAAAYQLKSWGVPEAKDKLVVPMKRFRASLDYLENAKETQASMRPLLTRLERIYLFFSIMDDADDTATPVLAIKRTDQMLKMANELTEKYVKSLKK